MVLGMVNHINSQNEFNNYIKADYNVFPFLEKNTIEKYSIESQYEFNLKKSKLGFILDYDFTNFTLNTKDFNYVEHFSEAHTLKIGVSYNKLFDNNISISSNITPVLSSNMEQSIVMEDFYVLGDLAFSKKWNKKNSNYNFSIGITQGNALGKPSIYPTFSISKTTNNWNYTLGFPESKITYTKNQHLLSLNGAFEGNYINNNALFINTDLESYNNSKITYKTTNINLEYGCYLSEKTITFFRLGYLPTSDIKITNSNNNTLQNTSSNNGFSFSLGLKFNLK